MDDYGPDDVAYHICGCGLCMHYRDGSQAIYDGVIAYVLNDGRVINRFKGEGSRRETRTDEFLSSYRAAVK